MKSLEQLILLGALTDDYKLSDPVGKQMARLPLDPMYSKALIVSTEFKCLEGMLIDVSSYSCLNETTYRSNKKDPMLYLWAIEQNHI